MAIPDSDVVKLYQEISALRQKIDEMSEEHKAVVKFCLALKPLLNVIKSFGL
jgi:hypothetical protein